MITSSVLLLVLLLAIYLFVRSSPRLPVDSDTIIAEVLVSDTIEQVYGDSGYADASGVRIWYNRIPCFGTKRGTIVLVMGHSSNVFAWPDYFIDVFLKEGYDVIRYDNRGIGMSDWIKDWSTDNAYTLEDMAKDCIAILDKLGEQKVHLIGASMGGMIAQRLAISYTDRFCSLTSIMSSGYMEDPKLTLVPKAFSRTIAKIFSRYGWRPTEHNMIKIACSIVRLLRNNKTHTINVKDIAQKMKYDMRKRRGFNRKVVKQHSHAIKLSGSRYNELGSIKIPTLIIHGKSDPLVKFEHALKYAPLIPHAKILYLDGMGHDLPIEMNGQITNAIKDIIVEAEKTTTGIDM